MVSSCWMPGMFFPVTGSILSSSGLPMSKTFTSPETGGASAVTSTSTCCVCTMICVSTTVCGVAGAEGAQLANTILQRTAQTNAPRICDFMLTPPFLIGKERQEQQSIQQLVCGASISFSYVWHSNRVGVSYCFSATNRLSWNR